MNEGIFDASDGSLIHWISEDNFDDDPNCHHCSVNFDDNKNPDHHH